MSFRGQGNTNNTSIIEYLEKCWKEVEKLTNSNNPYMPESLRLDGPLFHAQVALSFMVRGFKEGWPEEKISAKLFDAALSLPCILTNPAVRAFVIGCKAEYSTPKEAVPVRKFGF